MGYGDLKVEVECASCGRIFRVPNTASVVPKHPPKEEHYEPGLDYIPCIGSDTIGVPIRPVTEGLE